MIPRTTAQQTAKQKKNGRTKNKGFESSKEAFFSYYKCCFSALATLLDL